MWWLCSWLWWQLHNTKTDTNNLANRLKIPLSGYRDTNGITFQYRGSDTVLWSSTSIPGDLAYNRHFYWNVSTINRNSNSITYGNSVRCLKD
jgi:hypothetical protein